MTEKIEMNVVGEDEIEDPLDKIETETDLAQDRIDSAGSLLNVGIPATIVGVKVFFDNWGSNIEPLYLHLGVEAISGLTALVGIKLSTIGLQSLTRGHARLVAAREASLFHQAIVPTISTNSEN